MRLWWLVIPIFEIISKLSKEIQNGKENKKNINTLLDKIEKSYIRICNKY